MNFETYLGLFYFFGMLAVLAYFVRHSKPDQHPVEPAPEPEEFKETFKVPGGASLKYQPLHVVITRPRSKEEIHG